MSFKKLFIATLALTTSCCTFSASSSSSSTSSSTVSNTLAIPASDNTSSSSSMDTQPDSPEHKDAQSKKRHLGTLESDYSSSSLSSSSSSRPFKRLELTTMKSSESLPAALASAAPSAGFETPALLISAAAPSVASGAITAASLPLPLSSESTEETEWNLPPTPEGDPVDVDSWGWYPDACHLSPLVFLKAKIKQFCAEQKTLEAGSTAAKVKVYESYQDILTQFARIHVKNESEEKYKDALKEIFNKHSAAFRQ